ncbi:MAG: spore coat associated protein CotJA [Lachnospiraceae bacterium]|nr:spore coat associated protein CotJA [Lachnospiraceae bacterium]
MQNYSYEKTIEHFPIAMSYVPWQHFTQIYENLEEGYCEGTIFPELNKPFMGRRCHNGK